MRTNLAILADPESGLTLLEVLAAAMIFSMVMTVLIGTSSTAVHHVGVSARRLEANAIADSVLVDLELQMKQGLAPEIEESEFTQDVFAIRSTRSDLFQDPANATPGAVGALGGAGLDVTAMLGAGLPEVAKHLKQYDIEVSWIEQNGAQRVTRTTFAFDWQTAAIEFSSLFDREGDGEDGGADTGPAFFGDGRATEAQKAAFLEQVKARRRGGLGHNARNDALGIADSFGQGSAPQ